MSKPFDAATKRLVEADPLAWLRFLGLPGEQAELMDADLSTIAAEADRILRVTNPDYLAHFELQATYKTDMGDRMLFYNVVAYYKYRLPIESAILLLRKEADGPAMSGHVAYGSLDFRFRTVRIWERTPEQLLSAPLALLPLAPLTDVSETDLPGVVRKMEQRIDREAAVEDRGMLWTTTFLLLGLKHDPEFSRQLLKGVMEMKESSTYQYILEEGMREGIAKGLEEGLEKGLEQGLEKGLEKGLEEGKAQGMEEGIRAGRAEEARNILLFLGKKRLGEPDTQTQATLAAVNSPERLEQLIGRVIEVESWKELLEGSASSP